MAAPNTHTIRDPKALQACTLAGISVAKERLVTFTQLRAGIDQTLRDLDNQRRKEKLIESAFLLAKFTKATCDSFLGLAAELSIVLGPAAHKAAGKVKDVYGLASVGAETAGTLAAGGQVDYAKTTTALTKAAASFIDNKGAQFAVKSNAVKAELVIGAMNGDKKSVQKSAIEYGVELGRFSLDALELEKQNAFVGIASEAFNYKQTLDELFDEALAMKEESSMRYVNTKAQFQRFGKKFQAKIDELQDFIRTCEAELAPPNVSLARP
jgi:hypothetical protein